jgi:bacillithiol biosynthesis cysteine-adding enzyme BshC
MLYHFFAEDGLVIVDGDDAILKRLFMPVIENELLDQFSFPVVNESIRNFSENYPSQISPREINLFYLDAELRQRIVKEGDRWKVLNTGLAFSEEQLKDLIHSQPEKFSPNVVLRPMYQELVLPNIAFIGGGAEVTYWLELKPLFDAVELHYPMILLRNSALWIDRGNSSRMQKLSVEPSQIFQPEEQLIRDYLQRQTGSAISLEEEKKSLSEIMEQLLKRTVAIDASLKGAVEAEAVKMQKSLDAVEDRIRKSLKKREEISVQQIHTLKERLFPASGLQERHDNFMSYYTRYGDEFFEALKSAFDPLAKVFTVLVDE